MTSSAIIVTRNPAASYWKFQQGNGEGGLQSPSHPMKLGDGVWRTSRASDKLNGIKATPNPQSFPWRLFSWASSQSIVFSQVGEGAATSVSPFAAGSPFFLVVFVLTQNSDKQFFRRNALFSRYSALGSGTKRRRSGSKLKSKTSPMKVLSNQNPTLEGWMIASLEIRTDFQAAPAGSHVVYPISSTYCQYPRKL